MAETTVSFAPVLGSTGSRWRRPATPDKRSGAERLELVPALRFDFSRPSEGVVKRVMAKSKAMFRMR